MLLDRPKLPSGCERAWSAFKELHASRVVGLDPNRISFTEIDAFQRVTGARLKTWEIDAVRRADKAFIRDWQSRRKMPG